MNVEENIIHLIELNICFWLLYILNYFIHIISRLELGLNITFLDLCIIQKEPQILKQKLSREKKSNPFCMIGMSIRKIFEGIRKVNTYFLGCLGNLLLKFWWDTSRLPIQLNSSILVSVIKRVIKLHHSRPTQGAARLKYFLCLATCPTFVSKITTILFTGCKKKKKQSVWKYWLIQIFQPIWTFSLFHFLNWIQHQFSPKDTLLLNIPYTLYIPYHLQILFLMSFSRTPDYKKTVAALKNGHAVIECEKRKNSLEHFAQQSFYSSIQYLSIFWQINLFHTLCI